MVKVSDLSSGKLQPTIVYRNVGPGDGSAGIWLSPDERFLYIANFSGREITAARFDRLTGTVSAGCSTAVRGLNNLEGGLATALPWGSGRTLYVAEPEVEIGIVDVATEGESCRLEETPQSPAHDFHTMTLESIGVFPPRRF